MVRENETLKKNHHTEHLKNGRKFKFTNKDWRIRTDSQHKKQKKKRILYNIIIC